MSHPEEDEQLAPAAAPEPLLEAIEGPAPTEPTAVPAPLPEAPVAQEPMPLSGGPYRIPPQPEPQPFVPGKRPRPVMGPALGVFGIALWAFVVAGQFTTSWLFGAPLSPMVAALFVVTTTVVTWITSVSQSRVAMPLEAGRGILRRAIAIFALAFGLFVASIVLAVVARAMVSHNHDLLTAFVLVGIATTAAIVGPRLTSPMRPQRTHGQRFAVVVIWVASIICTLLAGADLAANG